MKIRNRKLQRKKTTAEQGYAVADIPKENVIFADNPGKKVEFTRKELKDQLRQMMELARGLGSADVSGEFKEMKERMLDAIMEKTVDVLANKGMVFDLRRKIPYCGVQEKREINFDNSIKMEDVDDRLSGTIHPSRSPFEKPIFKNPTLTDKLNLLSEKESKQPIEIDLNEDFKKAVFDASGANNENSMCQYDEKALKFLSEQLKKINRKRKVKKPAKKSKREKEIEKVVKDLAEIKRARLFDMRSKAAKKGWETRRKNKK